MLCYLPSSWYCPVGRVIVDAHFLSLSLSLFCFSFLLWKASPLPPPFCTTPKASTFFSLYINGNAGAHSIGTLQWNVGSCLSLLSKSVSCCVSLFTFMGFSFAVVFRGGVLRETGFVV